MNQDNVKENCVMSSGYTRAFIEKRVHVNITDIGVARINCSGADPAELLCFEVQQVLFGIPRNIRERGMVVTARTNYI